MTVNMMEPGALIGCVAVFCGIALPARATALEPARTFMWPVAEVHALLARHSQLGLNALQIVGSKSAAFLDRIEEVSTEPAETRIARPLLRLDKHDGREVRVTRQELADLTVTTLHTVSRTISGWERSGWIKGGRRRVTLVEGHPMEARSAK